MSFNLPTKSVVQISGEDAFSFLQNILTNDLKTLPSLSALLSPQGKILFQFFMVERDGVYYCILEKTFVESFIKRLSLYKLRAKVMISLCDFPVSYSFEKGDFKDTRHEKMGYFSFFVGENNDATPYHLARISAHIPEIGVDFKENDVFPHDANMDKQNGVSFKKGCYIGQEVVSRMQHKTEIRKRFIGFKAEKPIAPFTPIMNGERNIGFSGFSVGLTGIMLVRLDLLEGELSCEGVKLNAQY